MADGLVVSQVTNVQAMFLLVGVTCAVLYFTAKGSVQKTGLQAEQ